MAYQCVWANSMFSKDEGAKRFGGKRGIRINREERFWAIVSCLVVVSFLYLFSLVAGDIFFLFFLTEWYFIVGWGIAALIFGRRLAYKSPVSSQTGEGMGDWMRGAIRKMSRFAGGRRRSDSTFSVGHSFLVIASRKQRKAVYRLWRGTFPERRAAVISDPDEVNGVKYWTIGTMGDYDPISYDARRGTAS